jgi:hypothetical protein
MRGVMMRKVPLMFIAISGVLAAALPLASPAMNAAPHRVRPVRSVLRRTTLSRCHLAAAQSGQCRDHLIVAQRRIE